MKKKISQSCTLIELLIVVALSHFGGHRDPQLLESQTRSKTSRVKADRRSVATRIDAYVGG
jgi:2',3'-cyclic-nucleotide 2'-phosphodiesterase (5'-nucleotidase family)